MKSLKIIFAVLALTVSTLIISAYTLKDYNRNSFAIACYEYNPTITFNKLNPSNPSTFIQSVPFRTNSNWTIKQGDPNVICPGGCAICRMCFDNSVLGGPITVGSIADQLRFSIISYGGCPINGQLYTVIVAGTPINVYVFVKP